MSINTKVNIGKAIAAIALTAFLCAGANANSEVATHNPETEIPVPSTRTVNNAQFIDNGVFVTPNDGTTWTILDDICPQSTCTVVFDTNGTADTSDDEVIHLMINET